MFIELPVKKKVSQEYSELSEILDDEDIAETETVRVCFGIEEITNIFEARTTEGKSVCIIESTGYFYHTLAGYEFVTRQIGRFRDIYRIS